MKEKFCPSCGKETEKLIDGLCKNCFEERGELAEVPGEVKIERCENCGAFKIEGKWEETDLKEAVSNKLTKSVEFGEGVKDGEVKVKDLSDDLSRVDVKISGKIDEESAEYSEEINLKIRKTRCERCSKISSGYWEALLQIRGKEEKVKDAIEISQNILENSKGRGEFVSDFKEVENGVDIFLGSKSIARKIARKISSEFRTERKSSKTLSGEKEGKKTYRSTYLVRILD